MAVSGDEVRVVHTEPKHFSQIMDPESMGYAAVIEWLNPLLVKAEHTKGRPTAFLRRELKAEAGSSS